jgi:phosphinothricin acetyltransferase
MSATIRLAEPRDIPAITAIYGHHVIQGVASFELVAPGEDEMRERFEAVIAKGFPYFVAEDGGRVAGYAYASLYRARPAYRFALEDSVYVHPDHARRGLGRALLAALIEACESIGCRQLIAVIGDSGNAPSIRLHAAQGFRMVGTLESVGWKHGRWLDCVIMQRSIGEGNAEPPVDR